MTRRDRRFEELAARVREGNARMDRLAEYLEIDRARITVQGLLGLLQEAREKGLEVDYLKLELVTPEELARRYPDPDFRFRQTLEVTTILCDPFPV
jgi:hypothetical protein